MLQNMCDYNSNYVIKTLLIQATAEYNATSQDSIFDYLANVRFQSELTSNINVQ